MHFPFGGQSRLKLILRLIAAFIFATFAAIFSDLIPPIPKTDPFLAKVFLTIFVGWVGFIVFPDIFQRLAIATQALFNFLVHQVSSEVFNQLLKLPRTHFPFGQTSELFEESDPSTSSGQGWYQIEYNKGQYGWISGSYLTVK